MTFSTIPAYQPLFDILSNSTGNPEETVNKVMEALARNYASSDVFYADSLNSKFCKDSQCLSQADESQAKALSVFAAQFQKYSPEKLAERFRALYVRAYHEEKGLMLLGHDDASQLAKRELDLWTGLVDYLAIRDIDFFNSILSSDVLLVETLNSPNMSAYHRGLFLQLALGVKNYSDIRHEYYNSLALDKPEDASYFELETAIMLRQGAKAFDKIYRPTPSKEEIDQVLDKLDPQRVLWNSLGTSSSEDVFAAILDAIKHVQDSKYANWIETPHFLSIALLKLESQGVPFNSYLDQSILKTAQEQGVSYEEMALTLGTIGDQRRGLLAWPTALDQKTNVHLDDYSMKQAYLTYLAQHYSSTLEALQKSELFPPLNRIADNAFANLVTLREFQAIRNLIKPEHSLETPRVALWDYLKDPKDQKPLVLTPEMLPPEVLSMAEGITVQGKSTKEHILENIDYVVFVPHETFSQLYPEANAFTFEPYKIVYVDKKDHLSETWYPSTLLGALSHEAAHNFYPEQGANIFNHVESERFANLYQWNVLDKIPLRSLPFKEAQRVLFETAVTKGRVSAANQVLGLALDNRELKVYNISNTQEHVDEMNKLFDEALLPSSIAKFGFDATLTYLALVSVPKVALKQTHQRLGKLALDKMIQEQCGSVGAKNRDELVKELFRQGRFAFLDEGVSILLGLDGVRRLTMLSDEQDPQNFKVGGLEILGSWAMSQDASRRGMMGRIPHPRSQWNPFKRWGASPYQERLATVKSQIQCNEKVVEDPAVESSAESVNFSALPVEGGIPVEIKYIGRDSLAIFAGVYEAAKIHSSALQKIQGVESLERVSTSFVVSPSITTYTVTPLVTAIRPLVVRPTFVMEPAAVLP